MSPTPIRYLVALLLAAAPSPVFAVDLADEIEAFLRVPAVAGREEPARDFIVQRLQGLPAETDRAGNVVLTTGSGSPRRLVACPLAEPGFVVSGIEPDGYLRLVPASGIYLGPLWEQAHEGNVVTVGGFRGLVHGAVTLRSVHLMQGPGEPGEPRPFHIGQAFIDVGAESAAEVAELGIRLLDPVALIRRPVRLAGGLISGPSARAKAACAAQIEAARALSARPGTGTTVFAWTANDLLNGAGLIYLVRQRGPFDEAVLLGSRFGWGGTEQAVPEPLPAPGSGLLGGGTIPAGITARETPYQSISGAFGNSPPWEKARIGSLGLPALYPETPVETISPRDADRLAAALVRFGGGSAGARPDPPALPPAPAVAPAAQGHEEVASLVGQLIAIPGVSGAEGLVRDEIRRRLPAWAKPEIDPKGNLLVTFGQGDEHVLFVAHMDEVGFGVTEILADGRLKLEVLGGLLPHVWEAQAAQVHGERGPVPAVFEPREDWRAAKSPSPPPLTVSLGVSSAREAEALGVRVGSTVTMPKGMFRLGRHRGVGRGFDDRNGSAALLLALRQIDPARLRHKVTFAWVVEEESGLVGSRAIAERMPGLTRVHPVDTFVSSDTPRESRQFAYAPLGKGPVLRTMDNASLVPRELIDRYLALAAREGIPVQYGFTGGASDGIAFLPNGAEMIPFSWPGRASHSPVEISDFRDVEALVRLVAAAATLE